MLYLKKNNFFFIGSGGGTGGRLISALHRGSLSVLKAIFHQYPSHRAAMILETLPLLSQVQNIFKI